MNPETFDVRKAYMLNVEGPEHVWVGLAIESSRMFGKAPPVGFDADDPKVRV